jgi:hypothetical protein
MKHLLFEIEKAFHLAAYYLEDHEGDPNEQYSIDCQRFKEAQAAFYKLLDIVNEENY